MAKTGFFDKSQKIYLPKDTTTWADLTSGWDGYTSWYSNLSASTTVEFTTDIIDFGSSKTVVPFITVATQLDGGTDAATFTTDKPAITIEASDVSDLSSGVSSVTLTRTSSPDFSTLGAKRYYRVTVNINSGTNSAPQGIKGINVVLSADTVSEEIENLDTSTVDDGSSVDRTISTRRTYSGITYVGVTPTTTITDTTVSGTSSPGQYVQLDYVAEGYFSEGVATITTSNITTVPLIQFVSSTANTFTIRLFKPNTGDEVDCTVDALVKGLPQVSMDINGNLVQK